MSPRRTALTLAALLPILLAVRMAAGNGQLVLTVSEREGGPPVPCRIKLVNGQGRAVHPKKVSYWHDYLLTSGQVTLGLALGNYGFEIERGPEYPVVYGKFEIKEFADDTKAVVLHRHADMAGHGWWSGDLDVRRALADMPLVMQAEDLHVAEVVSWFNNKTSPNHQPAEKLPLVVDQNRFYHPLAGGFSRPGGSYLVFNLPKPLALGDDAGEYPAPAQLLAPAHAGSGWVDAARPYCWDLPTLAALGQIDSVQLVYGQMQPDRFLSNENDGRPRDHRRFAEPWGSALWSQEIYFQLLNCGLHIPPSAGSGSGATNNPPGYDRMYVHVDGDLSYEKWFESFRAGQVVVTNGPMLEPTVLGELPGHVFQVDEGKEAEMEIGLTLFTRDQIDRVEIIKDGQVAVSADFAQYAKTGQLPKVVFNRSGWFLIRVVTRQEKTYRFAMTAPYYVQVGYQPRVSRQAAQFFLDWIVLRARQLKLDDAAQRQTVLEAHRKARDFWQDLVKKANAD